MHAIRIDRAKRLAEEPQSGHNRYHPDISPALEVAEGEEVTLETRDALDGQLGPDATVADLATADSNLIHPLTGPVFIKGARPGDMIEVGFIEIVPQPTAFSAIVPGLGFLRDIMKTPFVVTPSLRFCRALTRKLACRPPWPGATRDSCYATLAANFLTH